MTVKESATEYPPDNKGECDGCHETGPLWTDLQGPGEFQYCKTCTKKLEKQRNAEPWKSR